MFSDPLMFYPAMLSDIQKAGKYIYLEIYRFRNDPIGIRFRDNLIKKCREGVKIKLLIDSWGASSNMAFFKDLIELGGEVKFFKKNKDELGCIYQKSPARPPQDPDHRR